MKVGEAFGVVFGALLIAVLAFGAVFVLALVAHLGWNAV